MKKRILSLVLVFVSMLTLLPATARAAAANGTCGDKGDNVKWALDYETGILTISGTGRMKDSFYSWAFISTHTNQPWDTSKVKGFDEYYKTHDTTTTA